MTYRGILTVIIILSVISPVMLLSSYVVFFGYDVARTGATRELSLIAEKAAGAVDNEVDLLAARATILSMDSDVQRGIKSVLFLERIDNLFRVFLNKNPLVSALILCDDKASVVTASPDEALKIRLPDPLTTHIKELVTKTQLDLKGEYDLLDGGDPEFSDSLFLVFPVAGLIGRITGALVARVPTGNLLKRANREFTDKISFDILNSESRKSIFAPTERPAGSQPMISAEAPLHILAQDKSHLYLLRVSEAEFKIFYPARQSLLKLISGVTIVVLVFGFLSFFVSRQLVKPIGQLLRHVEVYSAGQYKVPSPPIPFREFKAVASTLAVMGSRIEEDIRKITEDERIKGELAKANIQAELDALRQQMNPHFLFNTLNSVLTMISIDRAEAIKMITQLADLYRAIVDSSKTPTTNLTHEMLIVRNYLELEKVRFGGRLRFSFDLPENPDLIFIPGLVVQNLVENAVKHGIAKTRSGGEIKIEIKKTQGGLFECVISNSGGPPMASSTSTLGSSTGLSNTKKRLELLYGPRHSFSFQTINRTDDTETIVKFCFSGEKL